MIQTDALLPRVHPGIKQDYITTPNNAIGKIFLFLIIFFFNSYLNITTAATPSVANMNNNFFLQGYII